MSLLRPQSGLIQFIDLANTSALTGVDILSADTPFTATLLGSYADSKCASPLHADSTHWTCYEHETACCIVICFWGCAAHAAGLLYISDMLITSIPPRSRVHAGADVEQPVPRVRLGPGHL